MKHNSREELNISHELKEIKAKLLNIEMELEQIKKAVHTRTWETGESW